MATIPNFIAVRIIPRETDFLDRKSGLRGEIFYDRDLNTLRLYDGQTQGGISLAKENLENISIKNFRNKLVESKQAIVNYTVTVVSPVAPDTGNKYSLNGVYKPQLNFVVGYTYVFDQSDLTNVYYPNANNTTPNPHPLSFSSDNLNGELGGGTSYLGDVVYLLDNVEVTKAQYQGIDFNSATTRQVRITVTNSTPSTLYYWCKNHLNMGNSISSDEPGSGGGGGGGSTTVSVGASLPSSPANGNLWLNTNNGSLYVYINDGDSNQWMQPAFATPDLSSYATKTYVDSKSGFEFYVAADDSTQRRINNGNVIQFIGAGGVTTSTDADGNVTITSGGVGDLTFTGTTIDSDDSSAISFVPSVVFQSDITVQNDIKVDRINSVNGLSAVSFLSPINFTQNATFRENLTVENELFVTSIDTIDSSPVTFAPTVNFSSDIDVYNDMFVRNSLYATNSVSTPILTAAGDVTVKSSNQIILDGLATFYRSTEIINSIAGASDTVSHNFQLGSLFLHTSIIANFTANFINVPTTDDRSISIALILDQGANPYIPNAVEINSSSQTIKWSGGSEPSGTANYVDIVNFTLIRSGGSWTVLGSLSTYN